MIIDIPYLFAVSGVPRGHRLKYDLEHYGVLAAEVPECAADDAPVALRVEHLGGVTETRWHEGRHWLRSVPAQSEPTPRNVFMREPVAGEDCQIFPPDGRSKLEPDGRWTGRYPLDRSDYRRISWDNAEEARRRAQEFAEGLLVVDGILHHEVDVPIFHVSENWGVTLRHGRPGKETRSRDHGRPCDFFTAVRSDEMAAYVQEWYPSARFKGYVDVFIPGSLEFPDDRLSLLEHARSCLDVLEPGLSVMDERSGVAWFMLRSKIELLDGLDEDAEAPAAEALLEMKSALDGMQASKRNFHGMHNAATIARRSLARWEMRPIELGFPMP